MMMDQQIAELTRAIQALTAKAAQHAVPQLWGVIEIAEWMRLSASTVSQRVVCQPDFPAPCQPTATDGSKRWFAPEVVEWTRTHRSRMPVARRRKAG